MLNKYFEYRKHKTNFKTEVIAGITIDLSPDFVSRLVVQKPIFIVSPRPKLGNNPSSTEKTQINTTPIRNVGKDTPINELVIMK